MHLPTILDEQFKGSLTELPPGYDTMKRYQQLAKTKFNVLIEFNGLEWVEKQNFEDLEKIVEEDNQSTRSKELSENIHAMDQNVRINKALYLLWSSGGSSDLSPDTLQANSLFENKTELRKHVYKHLKLFQISNDHNQINDIIKKSF